MLTRRDLLLATATALPAAALLPGAARAISREPLHPDDRAALADSCRATTSHADLVAALRQALDGDVLAGLRPAGYRAVVPCPFCRCSLSVTPDGAL